jgi:hypothetical protein
MLKDIECYLQKLVEVEIRLRLNKGAFIVPEI